MRIDNDMLRISDISGSPVVECNSIRSKMAGLKGHVAERKSLERCEMGLHGGEIRGEENWPIWTCPMCGRRRMGMVSFRRTRMGACGGCRDRVHTLALL